MADITTAQKPYLRIMGTSLSSYFNINFLPKENRGIKYRPIQYEIEPPIMEPREQEKITQIGSMDPAIESIKNASGGTKAGKESLKSIPIKRPG